MLERTSDADDHHERHVRPERAERRARHLRLEVEQLARRRSEQHDEDEAQDKRRDLQKRAGGTSEADRDDVAARSATVLDTATHVRKKVLARGSCVARRVTAEPGLLAMSGIEATKPDARVTMMKP